MDAALITEVMRKLEEIAPLAGAAAIVGFDGDTDTIVRVVRGSAPDGSSLHFRSKRDFGQEIVDLDSGNSSFDAGYCFGRLAGPEPRASVAVAAAAAGIYVATGDSPTRRDVVDFVRKRAADGHVLPSGEAAQ